MTSAGRRRPLLAAASLAAAAGAAWAGDDSAGAAPAPPEIRREIRLRLACDEEWRARKDWELRARDLVERASLVFEKRFGIRWRIVDVVTWTTDDHAPSLAEILDALEKDVPRTGADVVLGMTRQDGEKGADRPYALAGQADYYGPCAVAGAWTEKAADAWCVGSIVHELGHVLGAWHCATLASVMCGKGSRTIYDGFDPQSAAAIEVGRDLDFARGFESLDADARRRIVEIYRTGHAVDSAVPFVDAAARVAARLVDTDVRAARRWYRWALEEQEAAVPPGDPSLVWPLRALAWSLLRGVEQDWDEADRLLARARAILDATQFVEEPAMHTAFVSADLAWNRGRREEATAAYRKIYAARLAALGPFDPATLDIKRVLDRRGGVLPRKDWYVFEWAITPALPDEPGLAFDAPLPGTIHLRPTPAAGKSARLDEGLRSFEVAVPEAGRLALELRLTGEGAAAKTYRATAPVPAGFDPARPTLVGFSYRSLDDVPATSEVLQYVCRLFVQGPKDPHGVFCGADAPMAARACVESAPLLGGREFVRLPTAAPSVVFCRRWLVRPFTLGDAAGPGEVGAVQMGEVVIAGDGVGAKRTWRLELTFAPDKK